MAFVDARAREHSSVALKHYLQVTDEDFRRVSQGGAESGALLAQNTSQQPHAEKRKEQQETKQAPAGQGLVRRNAATCQNMQVNQVAGTGFEQVQQTLGNSSACAQGGAKSSALCAENRSLDPQLQLLIERWPTLSRQVQQQVMLFLESW